MVDLSTTWLGLSLRSPFVVAASPLSRNPDDVARAVDAGAGAVVMHSLFEEQLAHDQMSAHRFIDAQVDLDAETQGIRAGARAFSLDAEPYVAELGRLKRRVDVPVLASLNGTTPGGWTSYAKRLESAGADAIELNLYEVATSPDESGADVERRQLDVVRSVVDTVKVPVNVKLTSFYASVPAFARSVEQAGAKGITVFNRFYQPDVDLDALDVDRHLVLSTSAELPLRLHALALLSPICTLSLGCTGGVHTGLDAAKAIVSGAHVVQLASVLLDRGSGHVAVLRDELSRWLGDKVTRRAPKRAECSIEGARPTHTRGSASTTRACSTAGDRARAREACRRAPSTRVLRATRLDASIKGAWEPPSPDSTHLALHPVASVPR